jgi:hypothetical protein
MGMMEPVFSELPDAASTTSQSPQEAIDGQVMLAIAGLTEWMRIHFSLLCWQPGFDFNLIPVQDTWLDGATNATGVTFTPGWWQETNVRMRQRLRTMQERGCGVPLVRLLEEIFYPDGRSENFSGDPRANRRYQETWIYKLLIRHEEDGSVPPSVQDPTQFGLGRIQKEFT